MSRLIVGNLAAEIEMARAATAGPHPEVSARAAQLIARYAGHLDVFARSGDRLWRPGDPWPPAPASAILAWAETDAVAALRAASVSGAGRLPPAADPLLSGWIDRLWQLHPDPVIARRCNDRRFAFDLATRECWTLPGAYLIDDDAPDLPLSGSWVAKAPFSAAGRERVRFAAPPPSPERDRIVQLLARFGCLLLEPWVERLLDLGCAGIVSATGVELFPPHRIECDAAGVFRAAVIDDGRNVEPAVAGALRETGLAAGEALAAAGYRGPFSIDAYLWRDASGVVRLQRLSEINARLTFGLVARAAAERAGGGRFELRL